MDILARPSNRWRVLNEPRGFVRLIQWLMAIVAFALCADYESSFKFTYECGGEKHEQTINISYPYAMDKANPDFVIPESTSVCDPVSKALSGDVSPSAQWFVFVGVLSFLYCMLTLVYYVFLESDMMDGDRPPTLNTVDLVLTVLLTFFWLCAASSLAWAKSQLIQFTVQENFVLESGLQKFCSEATVCHTTSPGFTKLTSSVAFGFLNLFLWGAGSWFVWKEAPFFSRIDPPTAATPGV